MEQGTREKLAINPAKTPEADRALERSAELLQQLAQLMLFDPTRRRTAEAAARPLSDHLAEWKKTLIGRGDKPRHIHDTTRRARKMTRLCRATTWPSLTRSSIQIAFGKLRLTRTGRKTPGPATINHYFGSLKTFCKWMIDDGRADRSPMQGMRPFAVAVDIRHKRRALTADEVLKLLSATINAPTIAGIPGWERAISYLLATTTGLRVNELRTLTAESFRFGAAPEVIVEAAYSKNKRRDSIPLRQDVAAIVAGHIAQCGRPAQLFRFPANSCYALKKDLARAGIAYSMTGPDGGFADVHALRHTFVSNLFSSAATPKEAQTLARHQDARLTLNRYAHIAADAKRAAVERIPTAAGAFQTINR